MDILKSTLTEEIVFVYDNLKEAEEHKETMLSEGYLKISPFIREYMDETLKNKVEKEYPHFVIHENKDSYFYPPYFIYSCKYRKTLSTHN